MHFSHSLRYIFPCYLPNGMARWADSSTTKAANDQQELVLDVEVLHAHEGDVNGVAWQTNTTSSSSSQPLLATAGDDGLVKLWAYA